jgi:DGQHR domain-containing protein
MNQVTQNEEFVMLNENAPEYKPPERIPVVQGPSLRSGTPIISGFMPAGLLLENFEIPYYNHTTKRGYQRQPQPARINQLASELRRERVDLPTAILLNVRSRAALSAIKDGHLDLRGLLGSTSLGGKFFVVDGQHRILAFERAVEDGWFVGRDFLIPFTCMLGADEDEEMAQFYIVNSTAKAVRTDLAYALIKKRSETEDGLLEALQERGKDWQVAGQTIVERLAVESPVWRGRIRLPAMEKAGTIIPSASMVSSLKPILGSPFFSRLKAEQQLRVLDAFWEAVRNVLREAFDDPANFSVQKGVGVLVLHTLLPEIIEIVRDRGLSATDPVSFEGLIAEALTGLQGENAVGDVVSGIEFWAAAPRGAAGSYSSSAGRRVLMAKIRALLPQLDVD